MFTLMRLIRADIRTKSEWCYESVSHAAIVKTILTDGTPAMILYRLMQCAHRHRLVPFEMIFNKLNSVFCHCIIGRGAEFGPGFVLIHSNGVVINGAVRGGCNVHVEHQVTIGAERHRPARTGTTGESSGIPSVGDNVFFGAGAKVIGSVCVGDGARVGANAVVVHDVPPHCTVVGIPAKVVRRRESPSSGGQAPAESCNAEPKRCPACSSVSNVQHRN